MENEEFDNLVERALFLHNKDSDERHQIVVAIGTPYWVEPNLEAACPVAIHGYFGRLADIRGIDPLSALTLAIKLQESLLLGLPKNLIVYWPSGEKYFDR